MPLDKSTSYRHWMDGVKQRANRAKRRAIFRPRVERQKFIYDQTFRNDIEAVAYPLAVNLGRIPDFATPVTFVEKMRGLYLTHPNPLLSLAADKIEMRRYCALFDLPIRPPNMIAIYDDLADLDISTLPETCFLKVNDGCNANMMHTPGRPITRRRLRAFEKDWWQFDHWRRRCELHYRDIPRKLLVEEALSPAKDIREVGVFCAMGTPYLIYSTGGGGPTGYTAFDDKHAPLAQRGVVLPMSATAPLDQVEIMVETARILAAPFPHCRVDFMVLNERVVIGEITLSPDALRTPSKTPEAELLRGSLIETDRLDDLLAEGRRIAAKLDWPIETSFGHFSGDPRLSTGGV